MPIQTKRQEQLVESSLLLKGIFASYLLPSAVTAGKYKRKCMTKPLS